MKVGLKIRKGFTLVELLIVIVVIGILAAAMMLASGSASDSAKASSLLSELRNAKAAALIWFANHSGEQKSAIDSKWLAGVPNLPGEVLDEIRSYMDNTNKSLNIGLGRDTAGGSSASPIIEEYDYQFATRRVI